MKPLFVIAFLAASPVFADCPSGPDVSSEEARLLAEVRVAPNELAAQRLSNALWALWVQAPDAKAQALLDTGMQAHRAFDHAAALSALDELIAYCPDYAEGYNQRAFVNYTRLNYDAAVADLDRALARNPAHTGALTGKALSLMGLERHDEAQRVLREALKVNPWLSERRFLTDLVGEDL